MVKFAGMTIGIFCPKDSKAAAKIKFEAESRGHICKRMRVSDLYVEVTSEGLIVQHRKNNLEDFQVFVFRKVNSNESEIASVAAKYLQSKGKKVIDENVLVSNNLLLDLEKLAAANLPLLKRTITTGLKSARDVLMEFNHPAIVKPLDLPAERYTFSEDWTESFDIVRSEKSKKYEFVEAIENDAFIRVYLINNKVINALRKVSLDPEKKLNLSSKTKSEKFELSDEIIQIAEKASSVSGYEICSIDMVETEEGYKIIELERSPNFLNLNKVYGIKFESKIIDYLESL